MQNNNIILKKIKAFPHLYDMIKKLHISNNSINTFF